MTVGTLRQLGVRGLLLVCVDPKCRHEATMSLDDYPDAIELPSFCATHGVQQVRREADNCPPELERNADPAAEAARLMPEKLEFAPDLWRKRAEEARRLAELIEDNFTAETLVDIALQYDELAERAERRQRRRD
jgi:hypothetical protein